CGPTKRSRSTWRRTRSRGRCAAAFNWYRAAFRRGMQSSGDLTIKTPTTVLWGDGDAILPFAWSDRLPEFFSDLRLKKIEGAGHFMMREAPDRVNAEIIEFMGS